MLFQSENPGQTRCCKFYAVYVFGEDGKKKNMLNVGVNAC